MTGPELFKIAQATLEEIGQHNNPCACRKGRELRERWGHELEAARAALVDEVDATRREAKCLWLKGRDDLMAIIKAFCPSLADPGTALRDNKATDLAYQLQSECQQREVWWRFEPSEDYAADIGDMAVLVEAAPARLQAINDALTELAAGRQAIDARHSPQGSLEN